MMTPDDIDVWVRLDVGKGAHALDRDGDTLYDKPLKQDEKAIRSMLEHFSRRDRVLLVVDQPNTIGSLPLTVARDMGIAVAYLPGTAMRRTAQLPPETLRDAGLDDGDPRRAEAARRPRRGPHPRIHPPRQPPAEPAAADPPRV